jgi:DNA polymerase-3 subunit epsilon
MAEHAELHGTRCVHPEEFAILLKHLQPAAKKTTAAVPRPRTASAPTSTASPEAVDVRSLPAAHVSASPAMVRAWARANGWDVGERGRLPAEVTDAYRRAHDPLGHH